MVTVVSNNVLYISKWLEEMILNILMTFKVMTDIGSDGFANCLDLIISQCIHGSRYHSVVHKQV